MDIFIKEAQRQGLLRKCRNGRKKGPDASNKREVAGFWRVELLGKNGESRGLAQTASYFVEQSFRVSGNGLFFQITLDVPS